MSRKYYMNRMVILLLTVGALCASSVVVAQQIDVYEQSDNDILILFIHGLTGSGETTWANKRAKVSWPQIVSQDSVFAKADVATYSYPSKLTGSGGLSVSDIADSLSLRLEQPELAQYKSIILVSHSLGGLVTRNMLLKKTNHTSKVAGLFFLATPSGGSNLADIASWLPLVSSQVKGLQELENSNFLQSQTSQWQQSDIPESIPTVCAHEKVKYKGVLVVPQASAQLLCNGRPVAVNEDHINIVKPKDNNADVHLALRTLYQRIFEVRLFEPTFEDDRKLTDSQKNNSGLVIKANNIKLQADVDLGTDYYIFANDLDLNGHTLTGIGGLIIAESISNGHIRSINELPGSQTSQLIIAALNMSSVKLLNVGVDGVDGIDGTDGGNGRPGSNGRDGKCDGFGGYRGADPGGDGTAGGDGQDGSHGSNGMPGGNIYVITLNEQRAFTSAVTGGEGGVGGRGGRGGNGGVGGRGGSGCVGIGGSQTGESSGRAGANGKDGRTGNAGNDGPDGKVFYRQLNSVQALAAELPESILIDDYLVVIRERLMDLATN